MGFKIQFPLELEAEISSFAIPNMKNTTNDKVGPTGWRVLRNGKHSSSVGLYSIKILEELYLYFRSYDFLKSFSYNGPYGRKLFSKINSHQTLIFNFFKLCQLKFHQ